MDELGRERLTRGRVERSEVTDQPRPVDRTNVIGQQLAGNPAKTHRDSKRMQSIASRVAKYWERRLQAKV